MCIKFRSLELVLLCYIYNYGYCRYREYLLVYYIKKNFRNKGLIWILKNDIIIIYLLCVYRYLMLYLFLMCVV